MTSLWLGLAVVVVVVVVDGVVVVDLGGGAVEEKAAEVLLCNRAPPVASGRPVGLRPVGAAVDRLEWGASLDASSEGATLEWALVCPSAGVVALLGCGGGTVVAGGSL